jgi:hypothetical protein
MSARRDLLHYDALHDPMLQQHHSQPRNIGHLQRIGFVSSEGDVLTPRQRRLIEAQQERKSAAVLDLADKLAELAIQKKRKEEDEAFVRYQEEKRQEVIKDIRLSRKEHLGTFVQDAVVSSLKSLDSAKPVALDIGLLERASGKTTLVKPAKPASKSTTASRPKTAAAPSSSLHATQDSSVSADARATNRVHLTKRLTTAHQAPLMTMQYVPEHQRQASYEPSKPVHMSVQQQYDGSASKTVFNGHVVDSEEFQFYSLRKSTATLGLSVCVRDLCLLFFDSSLSEMYACHLCSCKGSAFCPHCI